MHAKHNDDSLLVSVSQIGYGVGYIDITLPLLSNTPYHPT